MQWADASKRWQDTDIWWYKKIIWTATASGSSKTDRLQKKFENWKYGRISVICSGLGNISSYRAEGGTGIGLSLVKAIMKNYDKAYGAINKEDGVEFYFELELEI